jgi:CheY-like chemotaxis protein
MTQTSTLALIVEDEPFIRELAVAAIEDAGSVTIQAANAQEAIDILNGRADVGVLFTDVNMPGQLDGLDLATLVHEQWPAIQLVVTSGRPLDGPVPDHGQFMAKPYSLRHLTETVALMAETQD